MYKRQVLFNAVIIGIEIAVMFPDPTSSAPIWLACITNGKMCIRDRPSMVSISVRPERYSHQLLCESGQFAINLPTRCV